MKWTQRPLIETDLGMPVIRTITAQESLAGKPTAQSAGLELILAKNEEKRLLNEADHRPALAGARRLQALLRGAAIRIGARGPGRMPFLILRH
jgi:hypothetical protein